MLMFLGIFTVSFLIDFVFRRNSLTMKDMLGYNGFLSAVSTVLISLLLVSWNEDLSNGYYDSQLTPIFSINDNGQYHSLEDTNATFIMGSESIEGVDNWKVMVSEEGELHEYYIPKENTVVKKGKYTPNHAVTYCVEPGRYFDFMLGTIEIVEPCEKPRHAIFLPSDSREV